MDVTSNIAQCVMDNLLKFYLTDQHPSDITLREWDNKLDHIYESMRMIINQDYNIDEIEYIQEGCDLLGKYFLYLFE